MRRAVTLAVTVGLVAGLAGCATKAQTGMAVGAGSGAVIGAVIGKATGNTAAGAVMGAAVGGIAGGVIGSYMDKQAAEMQRDLEGARIERIGEGIKITFAGGLLFDVDRADIRPDAQTNLVKLRTILQKYDDTNVLVEGHTDATGTEEHNMDLSLRRSSSVATFLAAQGVERGRLSAVGYGELQPIATNETTDGRQRNRRVEIAIWANDDLKAAAKRQAQN
ncbi:MAG: OmpA family protein [Gemmatimonadota bacterium]|nr:OmpA family protein [Gemmatimonadota bacterium]MDH5198605.1 OmpA family protein [Gemmatimonadota bacterium]